MKCLHPADRMVYDADFCACVACEQTWKLVRVNAGWGKMWNWKPEPPIQEKRRYQPRTKKGNFRK